jgi:hypothetical protein
MERARTPWCVVFGVARGVLLPLIMLASRQASPSVSLVSRMSYGLPRALEAVVGGMLEIAIHSIEGLRDHVARVGMLRARRTMAPM